MADEWTTFRLGDVCTKIGSGATPRGGSSVYLDRGQIALIRSQNVYNDGFRRSGITYLTEEHAAELANVEVAEQDVLLNITGDSVARSCQVDAGVLPARVNQHVAIIRPDPSALWPRFLRYFLTAPAMQAHMLSLAGAGATRNALTKGMIESFEVPAPADIAEQRAIAHILGTLDDKIELNRRMSETLEAIVRAFFKSWFVDFDPVRAKSEGRDPGLPPHLADLFPDSFENSELGEIPRGWHVGKPGELAVLTRDVCTPGDFPEEVFDHFSIPAFDEERRPKVENGESIKSNKFLVPAESVLVSKLNPRIPRIWMPTLEGSRRAVCSTEFLVALPRAGVSREFLFCLFSSDAFASVFETLVNGTSGSHQRVRSESFLAIDVAIPGEEVVRQFTNAVRPTLGRVDCTRAESDSLVALRDTLLPKLVSGQLRLDDAHPRTEGWAS